MGQASSISDKPIVTFCIISFCIGLGKLYNCSKGETRGRGGTGFPSGSMWPHRGPMALTGSPDLFLRQGPCGTHVQGLTHVWLVHCPNQFQKFQRLKDSLAFLPTRNKRYLHPSICLSILTWPWEEKITGTSSSEEIPLSGHLTQACPQRGSPRVTPVEKTTRMLP